MSKKILIAYYSQTGQTEKVAKAILEDYADNPNAKLKKLDEVSFEELENYDLLIVGSPCHSSDLAKPVKAFLKNISTKPRFKLAGFYTHASYPPEKGAEYEEVFRRWVGQCEITFKEICKEKEIEL